MRISKWIEIDAGHRVPMHTSKCRNPHGHRYRITVEVDGPVPEDGMVIDFGILKQGLNETVDATMDHAMILQDTDAAFINFLKREAWKVYVIDAAPTAENLAEHIADLMSSWLAEHGSPLVVTKVLCRETPSSLAVWES